MFTIYTHYFRVTIGLTLGPLLNSSGEQFIGT